MKNNDFDFIKDKFNSAAPDVPDSLDERVIKYKILTNHKHKVIQFKPKKNNYKAIISVAACFIFILGVAFAAVPNIMNADKIAGFNSYDDVNTKISELEMLPSWGGKGSGAFDTFIKTYEDGVETPASVKFDGEYIYCAYHGLDDNERYTNRVYIYKADNADTRLVSVIDNLPEYADNAYSDSYEVRDLFVKNNRLVVIMDKTNWSLSSEEMRDCHAAIIRIYDVSDKANPLLLTEFEQSGEYDEARMIGGTLYVSSLYIISSYNENYNMPKIIQDGDEQYADAENISYFENTQCATYAVLSTIDVDAGKQSHKLRAFLGGSADIYCTEDFIYINEFIKGEDYFEPERNVAAAMKLNLKNGKITYATDEEMQKYSKRTVDLGKGSDYNSFIYNIGDYMLNIGEHMDSSASGDITLYDKQLNVLDSLTSDDLGIASISNLEFDKEKGIYALSAYTADAVRRYYGLVVFKIENDKIVIINEIYDSESSIDHCVIAEDCIYGISVNTSTPDDEKIIVKMYEY